MKLHWSPRSPYVRKVMIAAHECGLSDRIETVRTVVAMDRPCPSLLPDNPLGKIPTLLLDDGSPLYDSLTICEYLDALAGRGLFPAAPARWTALTQHALGAGLLDILILWRNEREKAASQQTPGWLENFAVKTTATLDHMEALAPALASTPFDIGHLAIGCALGYLDFRFGPLAWRRGRPALAAWHQTFEARPSVQASAVADD